MFQNNQLKKLDDRYNSHDIQDLGNIYGNCHEQLEKIEFQKIYQKYLK